MHLLSAMEAPSSLEGEAIDLAQSPADIVILSAADTELALLAEAKRQLGPAGPSLRLASLLQLRHPMSVDLYVERIVSKARLVIVRLIGGRSYWSYGVEQVMKAACDHGVTVAFLPGDEQPDDDLARSSSLDATSLARLHAYLLHGGLENARACLRYAASLLDGTEMPAPASPMPRVGFHRLPEEASGSGEIALIVFYRALLQAADLAPVDALLAALAKRGMPAAALFVSSLREPAAMEAVAGLHAKRPIGIVLNLTGFALANGGNAAADPLLLPGCPILQAVLASDDEENWRARQRGLPARDLAMNVALPEVDGRILSRAISFKQSMPVDPTTEIRIVRHRPLPDRVAWVADLAASWVRLRATPKSCRRIAVTLSNYPMRDGRLANAVGLDTPASVIQILDALERQGYRLEQRPGAPDGLMDLLRRGVTNETADIGRREIRVSWPLAAYRAWFDRLPLPMQQAVTARWGSPTADPFVVDDAFALPILPLGNIVIGLQPARGYDIDLSETFHSPDLVPPHAYLAFYGWLRENFDAQAVVHVGKHGSLEWLPGKAMALSAECWPDALLGPLPHIYPFIVNDPGEGTQAKRRTAAVIIDHLTPPLARAGEQASLSALEQLLDEFAQAQSLDLARADLLRGDIFDLVRRSGLDRDLALDEGDDLRALTEIDRHLCDLKELQIRDGLHILGRAPEGHQRASLLLALTRAASGPDTPSLLCALAIDLGLGDFDPLQANRAETWTGPRPRILQRVRAGAWRLAGDTIERLEILAFRLVSGHSAPEPGWSCTRKALSWIRSEIEPLIEQSARNEIGNLLHALDGRFVPPGPSGAPSRGRLDALPTGRNFYSIDTRAVPTPAAWRLGWASAAAIVDRYLQLHGDWPRAIAISAWGTANMRTGGDDVAQVLALLGCRPIWDAGSHRVTGVEVLPLSVLGRPRVDVTLKISGFFRDAFPTQIELIDDAVRAVAALDEPAADNPVAAQAKARAMALEAGGCASAEAWRLATFRIFGSPAGAYGTGLQDVLSGGERRGENELASAFLRYGSHAYGRSVDGKLDEAAFMNRLGAIDLVVQNQDNREHDLLDSDGYVQFQGGLALAIRSLTGQQPNVFHADHSRPENPQIRPLKEELSLVVRGRAANPRWIGGLMRHGYKGASEMAATVDFLHAYALIAGEVESHHFDTLFEAYIADEGVRLFLEQANPQALREMLLQFDDALRQDIWRPRRNSVRAALDELMTRTAPKDA